MQEKVKRKIVKEFNRQLRRKQMYKQRFYTALVGFVVMTITNIVLTFIIAFSGDNQPKEPIIKLTRHEISETTPTPEEIWSSVYFGCSGTIISKGDDFGYGISCNHCYGVVGDNFTAHFPDGSTAQAKVEALAADYDLMLFSIEADKIIATSQVPLEQEPLEGPYNYTVVGYPRHKGPIWYDLEMVDPEERIKFDTGLERWVFAIDGEGSIEPGNSGCGVFINGSLCSVVSHRNNMNNGHTFRSCPHDYLVEFCRGNCRKEGGRWYCDRPNNGNQRKPGAKGPAEWKPTPKGELPEKPGNQNQGSGKPVPKHPKGLSDRLDYIEKLLEQDRNGQKAPIPDDGQKAPAPDIKAPAPNPYPSEDLLNLKSQLENTKSQLLSEFKSQLSPLQKLALNQIDPNQLKADLVAENKKVLNDVINQLRADIAKGQLAPSDIEAIVQNEANTVRQDVKDHITKQNPVIGGIVSKEIGKVTDELPLLKNKIDQVAPLIAKAQPGIGSLLTVGGLAGGIPALIIGIAAWLINKKGVGTNPKSNIVTEDDLSKLVDNLITQFQPPAPVKNDSSTLEPTGLPTPPTGAAPFVVTNPVQTQVDTVVVRPLPKDIGVQAFQAVKQMIVRLHPELVSQGILQKLDSMFNQALSGLQGSKR